MISLFPKILRDKSTLIIEKCIAKAFDIDINSFLVKEIYKLPNDEWSNVQIDGKSKTRFSLSRSDCSFLNVEYQEIL